MSLIWNLPKVSFQALSNLEEKRPTALITAPDVWAKLGSSLNLPLVVQAEPTDHSVNFLRQLAEGVPAQAKVVYCVGTGFPVTVAKFVASVKNLPLVIVPDAIDSDEIFEAHISVPSEGLLNRIETGPATEVIIDWDVIQAAPKHLRAAGIVDVLAIVTALLDWRYAARMTKNAPEQKFSAWGAGVAASLASQAIKSAKAIGDGDIEGLRTLVDLIMISVQLAGQLGHDRHQEGTEHYFAFSLENQGVTSLHSESVGAGILFASALHGQDPASLREALTHAGVEVDKLRASDIRLAINDLPTFCTTNALPFARAHDIDPLADYVAKALERAGIVHEPPMTDDELDAFSNDAAPAFESETREFPMSGENTGAVYAIEDETDTTEAPTPVVGSASPEAETQIEPRPTSGGMTPMGAPPNPYVTPSIDDDTQY